MKVICISIRLLQRVLLWHLMILSHKL
jgi:hypothetical protein